MALEACKTEHGGARPGGERWARRAELKRASRKHRRTGDRRVTSDVGRRAEWGD